MSEIVFKFEKKDYTIKYDSPRKIKEVLEEFANEHSLDIDKTTFIDEKEYKPININLDLFLEQVFDIDLENPKRIEIIVIEKPIDIRFDYQGKLILISAKKEEKMKIIFEKFASKAQLD